MKDAYIENTEIEAVYLANTNWLNEDGIPVYIQSDIYGAGDYLWALEKVEEASSDRYNYVMCIIL